MENITITNKGKKTVRNELLASWFLSLDRYRFHSLIEQALLNLKFTGRSVVPLVIVLFVGVTLH